LFQVNHQKNNILAKIKYIFFLFAEISIKNLFTDETIVNRIPEMKFIPALTALLSLAQFF